MTQPSEAWIAALFAPVVKDGVTYPPRPQILFTGPSAPQPTDDPANKQTIWTFPVSFTPGGDVGGTSTSQTVVGWRGKALDATTMGAPGDATIPIYDNTSTSWKARAISGDISITRAGVVTVLNSAKLNGATVPAAGSLTTGNVLQVSGGGALTYAPLNLAGGAGYITGTLPTGNQAAQAMGGDVSGTTAAATVAKVNGTSVPAAPTAGSVLLATGSTSSAWVDPYAGAAQQPYPLLATHKVKWLNGETNAYNSSTPTAGVQYAGWSTLSFNGTTTTPSFASTSRLNGTKRLRFQTTVAAAFTGIQETGYVNAGVTQWGSWRGNAANRGGFLFRCRFAVTSIGVSSTLHCFVGLIEAVQQQSTSFDYTTDTTTCKLGIGFTATTTAGGAFPAANWKAIESAHASPTLTDFGSGFALTLNDFIEVIMYAAPNDNKVTLTLNNLTSGATTTVTLNTTLPTNTVMLGTQIVLGTQTITSGTNAIDISLIYLEDFDG